MNARSFMDLALKAADAAGKSGEVPIGCVIVRDGEVIAASVFALVWLAILNFRKKSGLPEIRVSGSGCGCARNIQ